MESLSLSKQEPSCRLLTENHQTSTRNDAWKLCRKAKMEILEHGSVMNLLLCPATKFRVSWPADFPLANSWVWSVWSLLCISKHSNLKIVATPPFLWICADVPSTGPSWRCPAEPFTRFAAVRWDAKPPRRTARSWSYHGLCQEGVGSLRCHLRCWKWWWLHTCFLSRPIKTNDKIFEVRSRYSYCILLHMYYRFYDVYLMNFTWDTFEQIAQYWLVGSLILCFWSLQVDALWNARRRWSCTGRSAKHHEAMQLASKCTLYQLNCGWVELWKPHSRNFMKIYRDQLVKQERWVNCGDEIESTRKLSLQVFTAEGTPLLVKPCSSGKRLW